LRRSGPPRPFFPASCCHAPLSRRQLLVGGGAALAAGALGRLSPARAGDDGTAIIRRYAASPDDPWRLVHGLRGMGRTFEVKAGRSATDYLLETYLVSVPVNGKEPLGFPAEVEVHQNSFLKTMLEAGVPLDHTFAHQGRRRTLQDVVAGAHDLFRPRVVLADPNQIPWSLIALAKTTSPLRRHWTNAWGEPVDLDVVVETGLAMLERASAPLAQAMRQDGPSVPAPVHNFTCGGTHMLYGLLTAVHAGYATKERAERVQRQVDIMVWRTSADLALIERFYKERAGSGGAAWYELESKLKLLGHAEECFAFAANRGAAALSPAQQAQRRTAAALVRRMLDALERRGLDEPLAIDRELFRQIVGDACHARHGLTFA
jgi:hypothetical protein